MHTKKISRGLYVLLLIACVIVPQGADAQEQTQSVQARATLIEVTETETRNVAGTTVEAPVQELRARIIDGPHADTVITVSNDYTPLSPGDQFFVQSITHEDETVTHHFIEPYRLPTIAIIAGLFILLVLVFGGWQGIRGLLSLGGSIFVILFLLLPGLRTGTSPLLISLGISTLIIVFGSYLTHGLKRTTTAAVLGMVATISLTGIVTLIGISHADISALASEEAVYLSYSSEGAFDLTGLLLGGILIGLLGILYDAAIGQAVAVEELFRTQALSRRTVFTRAVRIGREHIGALVNSLAIAYVGASLPLLLYLYDSQHSWQFLLNQEFVAIEVLRILLGSIGLILTVPITTLIAVAMLDTSSKESTDD